MSIEICINKLVTGKNPYIIPVVPNNTINLSTNENLLTHSFSNDFHINKYPNTIDSEYIQLIQQFAQYTSTNVDSILITSGSGAGLKLILQTFTNTDTEILIPTPNYPGFLQDAKLASANISTINIINSSGFESGTPFMQKIDQMSSQGSGVVYVSSPNMPFGYTISESFINTIRTNPKLLFIIDQAYAEYDSEQAADLFTKLTATCLNVIVVKTLSKAFAAAGIRIGYLVANPVLVQYLRVHYCTKSVSYNSYSTANKIMTSEIESQFYTKKAIADLSTMSNQLQQIESICDSTKQVKSILFSKKAPFFILQVEDAAYVCGIFNRNGLLVRDKTNDIIKSDHSFMGNQYVRISMCDSDNMKQIITIVSKLNYISLNLFDTIFLDLDITLRDNYDSPISDHLKNTLEQISKHTTINIITDNRANTNIIEQYLSDNSIPVNQLYTPFNTNGNIILSLEDVANGYKLLDDSLLVTSYPTITLDLMQHIETYKHIKVVEESYYERSSELTRQATHDIKIPFVGAFLQTINQCDYKYQLTIIGKSDLSIDTTLNTIHIGDSTNDYNFAQTNGIYFKHVDSPEDTLAFLQSLLSSQN